MIKIALCQIRTEIEREDTMAKAKAMVKEAAENGADFVVLPEMFDTPYSGQYFKKYARLGHEKSYAAMSAWAKEYCIYIVGGSIPELCGEDVYNTCFVFDREGKEIARHRKIHLFDVELPGLRVTESRTFKHGNDITLFETEFGTMGCAVCFDLRFPELFRTMANRGAQVIFLPAQFSMTTGPKAWEPMIRSRASDYQVFMVGCVAARYVDFAYEAYGHSTVIDPSGRIMAMAGEGEEILYVDVDLEQVNIIREQMPTRAFLRRDLYSISE